MKIEELSFINSTVFDKIMGKEPVVSVDVERFDHELPVFGGLIIPNPFEKSGLSGGSLLSLRCNFIEVHAPKSWNFLAEKKTVVGALVNPIQNNEATAVKLSAAEVTMAEVIVLELSFNCFKFDENGQRVVVFSIDGVDKSHNDGLKFLRKVYSLRQQAHSVRLRQVL
jgi:hypothetical protein